LVLLFAVATFALINPRVHVDETLPGQYIVVYHDKVSPSQIEDHKTAVLAFDNSNQIKFTYSHAIKGFSGNFSQETVQFLTKNSDVKMVVPDGIARISQQCGRQVLPSGLWGLGRSSTENRSPSNSYPEFHFGEQGGIGVRAFIIDTGIYHEHSDFQGRAIPGYNAVDNVITDQNGHGTHVASTVGGIQYGVAKKTTLVSVKVLGAGGSGTWAQVIAGIDYVAREGTPNNDVANMSLGGASNAAVNEAVNGAVGKGIFMAVAAGNDYGADACRSSPAGAAGAFTVGSTMNNDQRSSFSNIGSCVNIFAPGSNVLGAWIGNPTASNTISGTSMASPHVCGAAALVNSIFGGGFTPADLAQHLETVATPNVINGGTNSPNRLLYLGKPCSV